MDDGHFIAWNVGYGGQGGDGQVDPDKVERDHWLGDHEAGLEDVDEGVGHTATPAAAAPTSML